MIIFTWLARSREEIKERVRYYFPGGGRRRKKTGINQKEGDQLENLCARTSKISAAKRFEVWKFWITKDLAAEILRVRFFFKVLTRFRGFLNSAFYWKSSNDIFKGYCKFSYNLKGKDTFWARQLPGKRAIQITTLLLGARALFLWLLTLPLSYSASKAIFKEDLTLF